MSGFVVSPDTDGANELNDKIAQLGRQLLRKASDGELLGSPTLEARKNAQSSSGSNDKVKLQPRTRNNYKDGDDQGPNYQSQRLYGERDFSVASNSLKPRTPDRAGEKNKRPSGPVRAMFATYETEESRQQTIGSGHQAKVGKAQNGSAKSPCSLVIETDAKPTYRNIPSAPSAPTSNRNRRRNSQKARNNHFDTPPTAPVASSEQKHESQTSNAAHCKDNGVPSGENIDATPHAAQAPNAQFIELGDDDQPTIGPPAPPRRPSTAGGGGANRTFGSSRWDYGTDLGLSIETSGAKPEQKHGPDSAADTADTDAAIEAPVPTLGSSQAKNKPPPSMAGGGTGKAKTKAKTKRRGSHFSATNGASGTGRGTGKGGGGGAFFGGHSMNITVDTSAGADGAGSGGSNTGFGLGLGGVGGGVSGGYHPVGTSIRHTVASTDNNNNNDNDGRSETHYRLGAGAGRHSHCGGGPVRARPVLGTTQAQAQAQISPVSYVPAREVEVLPLRAAPSPRHSTRSGAGASGFWAERALSDPSDFTASIANAAAAAAASREDFQLAALRLDPTANTNTSRNGRTGSAGGVGGGRSRGGGGGIGGGGASGDGFVRKKRPSLSSLNAEKLTPIRR